MKQIYFVRHGESELNKAGKWSGSTESPLTPNGRKQAKSAGVKAREVGLSFDLIISSPLERAQQTAKLIAFEMDYPENMITAHAKLVERHYGELENKVHNPLLVARSALGEAYIEKYGAEKLLDLQKRADEVLAHLHELPHQRILVVGHGASGRALWRAVNKHSIHNNTKRYDNAKIERLL